MYNLGAKERHTKNSILRGLICAGWMGVCGTGDREGS